LELRYGKYCWVVVQYILEIRRIYEK